MQDQNINETQKTTSPQPPSAPQQSDSMQVLMPTQNKDSIISYYLGFASFLPVIGLFTAIAALVYASKALKLYKIKPTPGAKGHALTGRWLAIVLLPFHILGALFVIMPIILLIIAAIVEIT